MVPSGATAMPRGPSNSACPGAPSSLPFETLPATFVTVPDASTRTILLPSATTTVPSGATATAEGCVSAVVTVLTCTPLRYAGFGAPGGSCRDFTGAGNVPSPPNVENRFATSCWMTGSHIPAPANARDHPTLPAANTCAPLGAV